MSRILGRSSLLAGTLLGSVLLAFTPAFAQLIDRSVQQPQSIISLAPSPKPEGAVLARHPSDARFEHAPANYHVFAAATAGEDAGVETLTLNFAGETTLTRIESKNKDFVIESGGTCHEGNSYGRGQSCTLLVRFDPQGPGHRLGFVKVTHSAEAAPMTFGLTGNGYAPVASFIPATIITVPGTSTGSAGKIKSATRLAADGGDTIYVADTGNNLYREVEFGVSGTTITPTYAPPLSIAVDTFGDLYNINAGSQYYFGYVSPLGSQSAFSNSYTPTTCTESNPCSLSKGVGLGAPANASMDANDNLYLQEVTEGAAELPVATVAGGTSNFDFWHLNAPFALPGSNAPSFAVDAAGNLYSSLITTTGSKLCWLVEEPLATAESPNPVYNRIAGASKCGALGDGGPARDAAISATIGQMAFDAAGNFYFADTGNQRVRRIDAVTGIIRTVAGTGGNGYSGDGGPATDAEVSNPTGIAVDAQGQVYILSSLPAGSSTQVLRQVISTAGNLTFASLDKGLSTYQVLTLSNTGNDTLTFAGAPVINGTNAGDFAVDPAHTGCLLAAGATLAAGKSCTIAVDFTPSAVGARGAVLYLPNNTAQGWSIVNLKGAGVIPQPSMSITSPGSGSTVTEGTTVTFAVKVSPAVYTVQPTGSVTFSVNSTTIGVVTLSGTGTASVTFTEKATGSYTLNATYNGDNNYAAEAVSESLTVAAVKAPVNVNLVPAVESAYSCGAPSFGVQVFSKTGGSPTGTVELLGDSAVLGSAALKNGAATLSPRALPPGAHTLAARYSGDNSHEAGTSSPVVVTIPAIGGSCGAGPPAAGPSR